MSDHLRQIRRLIFTLICSGSLNIILIAVLFYVVVTESPPIPYFENKPAEKKEQLAPFAGDLTNSQMVHRFLRMSTHQLKTKLHDKTLVENGFAIRDLALACLTSFHHFDLSRALQGLPPPEQKRTISYGRHRDGTPATLVVFPGLSEKQFQAISDFAQTEKWPLTNQGLFLALRRGSLLDNTSLAEAFFLTQEFLAAETLFNRAEVPIEKNELLQILLEGTWKMLSEFTNQQKKMQDLSAARRQRFLLDYIQNGSNTAAYALLKTDGDFAVKKLDDQHILLLLKLIKKKNPEAEKFALALLISPRSDAVWKLAANRLYEFAGEPIPEKFQHHAALLRFGPKKTIAVPEEKQQEQRLYTVQEGDSLWKIAKRLNSDVDAIRALNHLENDLLKPGTALKIPK